VAIARTKRMKIVNALVELLKQINGIDPYVSNLYNNVQGRLIWWDQVNDFPFVCVTAADEVREYLPSDFKWGFLGITIRIYVQQEEAMLALEDILADIEHVIDTNFQFEYEPGKYVTDTRITSISTDEGVMDPMGIGEISLQCRYEPG
jgi:hypothetical protein